MTWKWHEVMETFCIWIGIWVREIHAFVKTYQMVYLKFLLFHYENFYLKEDQKNKM